MTMGIYALWWPNTDSVYVGQSVRIERRISDHSYKAMLNTDSKALNIQYSYHGMPEAIILEECLINELDHKEQLWILEFDNTLNSSIGGSSGNFGYNSGNCSYTKEELLEALKLLSNPEYSLSRISNDTNISIDTISGILYQKRHTWISQEYPDLLKKAQLIDRCSIAQEKRFNTNVILISPEGTEYVVTNIAKFAREHKLNKGHLSAVARGNELKHKNWTRKEVSANE